ncbi:MAG: hypothetical protein Q4E54_00505 [Lachnospiraceae bacterium]|nr:hypothetical protein [Lachnospiraceae bacterium]
MLKLLYSLIYLSLLGILAFPFGRMLAGIKWNPDRFPFKEYSWEDGGRFYDRCFKIRKWKDKVPDVSKWVSGIVPKKTLKRPSAAELDVMIQETCVAELTHLILCPVSIPVIFIMNNIGGIILFIIDVVLGNIPFAMIQRYNRFRYLKARRRFEGSNSKCQYRDRS